MNHQHKAFDAAFVVFCEEMGRKPETMPFEYDALAAAVDTYIETLSVSPYSDDVALDTALSAVMDYIYESKGVYPDVLKSLFIRTYKEHAKGSDPISQRRVSSRRS